MISRTELIALILSLLLIESYTVTEEGSNFKIVYRGISMGGVGMRIIIV